MITGISEFALLVRNYDEAKQFYSAKLGFTVIEDTLLSSGKRWLRLKAPGNEGAALLLSKITHPDQDYVVGNQAAGRVLFFLYTTDLLTDYETLRGKGIEFTEPPREETYGAVAVFQDLYGNRIDLIEPKK